MEESPELPALDELIERREPVLARSLARADSLTRVLERRREIEEALYRKASGIVHDVLNAPDVDPEDEEGTRLRFLQAHNGDAEAAERALRVARAGWCSKPPAFMVIAAQQLASLRRVPEENERATINAQVVVIQAPADTYPELVVDGDAL